MDQPNPLNSPPQIGTKAQIWKPNTGLDPAARIPYSRFRYNLPKIVAGQKVFVWPTGVEGFTRSGSATLGIHKYLGRAYVDVHVMHRDEAHIDMRGVFAGLTSKKNMLDLIDILTAAGPKLLYVPGVFTKTQTVFCQNYNFDHSEDDQTHSISYTVEFVRTTTGVDVAAVNKALSMALLSNPQANANADVNTNSYRTTQVTDSSRTLRSISNKVYGTPDDWRILIDLNAGAISSYNPDLQDMSPFELSQARLPTGMVLRY